MKRQKSKSYLCFSMEAEDFYIRDRFKYKYGEFPQFIFEEGWNKWAGPVTKKHLEYEEEKKNE